MDETPEVPVTPEAPVSEPLSEAALTLHNQFKAIDPQAAGVGLDRIRQFYPKQGWSVMTRPAKELEAAGLLTRRAVMNAKGRVGYELYTWKEAN